MGHAVTPSILGKNSIHGQNQSWGSHIATEDFGHLGSDSLMEPATVVVQGSHCKSHRIQTLQADAVFSFLNNQIDKNKRPIPGINY